MTTQFNVRCAPEDIAIIEAAAEKAGVSRVEFARRSLIAAATAIVAPDVLMKSAALAQSAARMLTPEPAGR